jgi:hypothetical protein
LSFGSSSALPLHGRRTPRWLFERMVRLARETYDLTIKVLHPALERAKVRRSEKIKALERLADFATKEEE